MKLKFKSREWEKLSPNVWQHESGLRIHDSGLIRFGSQYWNANHPYHYRRYDRLTAIHGCKRRALMAISLELSGAGDR